MMKPGLDSVLDSRLHDLIVSEHLGYTDSKSITTCSLSYPLASWFNNMITDCRACVYQEIFMS